jgi:hypothetical protein
MKPVGERSLWGIGGARRGGFDFSGHEGLLQVGWMAEQAASALTGVAQGAPVQRRAT